MTSQYSFITDLTDRNNVYVRNNYVYFKHSKISTTPAIERSQDKCVKVNVVASEKEVEDRAQEKLKYKNNELKRSDPLQAEYIPKKKRAVQVYTDFLS